MKAKAALLAAAGWLMTFAAAAEDAEGCKDHALFTRLPAYDIFECDAREFDAHAFPLVASDDCDAAKKETAEGAKYFVRYMVKDGAKPASLIQIQRNFANAVRKAGGTVVAESGNMDDGKGLCVDGSPYAHASVFKMRKGAAEVWSVVTPFSDGSEYMIHIVEREAMRQDVVASDLLAKINQDGYVALYINFDTGKASIKPDSLPTIEQVAAMLKSAPELKLEVGGHTDNVGAVDANQKLSEDRARAVMAALVGKGIAAGRLTAKGYGQTAPVADNRNEEGRAKNRRVELTKR